MKNWIFKNWIWIVGAIVVLVVIYFWKKDSINSWVSAKRASFKKPETAPAAPATK